eukprot:7785181-Pyramimonas_sp.AAC.1
MDHEKPMKWIRQMLERNLLHCGQWWDARGTTADGHAAGSIGRELLLQVISGHKSYEHSVKKYVPH